MRDFTPIGRATQLRRLTLKAPELLAGLGWLAALQQLEELSIEGCTEVEDFTPIGQLEKLRFLRFHRPGARDYRWIRGLTALERMCFSSFSEEDGDGYVLVHPPGNVEPYLPRRGSMYVGAL